MHSAAILKDSQIGMEHFLRNILCCVILYFMIPETTKQNLTESQFLLHMHFCRRCVRQVGCQAL